MYPFGSGMPQPPHSNSTPYPPNNHTTGMPIGVPFGAGWIAPAHQQQHSPSHHQQQQQQQHQYHQHQQPPQQQHHQHQQQAHLHYQPLPISQNRNQTPYPSSNQPQHQQQQQQQQQQAQHQSHYQSAPYPNTSAPYPTSTPHGHQHQTAPYPGSSYPHNPQQQTPYPSASTPTHGGAGGVGVGTAGVGGSAPYPSNSHNPHYTHPPTHPSYAPTHGYTPVMTSSGYESPAGIMAHCFEELAHRHGGANVPPHGAPFARKEKFDFIDSTVDEDDVGDDYEFITTVISKEDLNEVTKDGTPTVLAAQNFDPVKDAHDLRKAMRGFGTNEDALIDIICRRSNEQRQEIQRQYKTHFGKDLIEDIKSETSGNFENLLVGLLRPIVDFYCAELNNAMAGIGTDEDVLIEILCTLSNMEIHTIKHQYLRLYGAHLESELKSETSGNFKRLLISLCNAARDESGHVDPVQAQNDARELLKAGELRVGTDESTFNRVLCQRNYQQLKLVFQEYEKMTGHSFEKAIKKEFSGDIMEGLITIYRCVTNKVEYFASRLHKSMAGIGTNDNQLIRVIITRSEIDLADIKAAFERMYGKSLRSWIKGDTSGDYKHALYVLIGEQRSS